MIKEYITLCLKRLKANMEITDTLSSVGVNICDYEAKTGLVSIIEVGVATILSKGDEKQFELILNDIQWWLYEFNVPKIIGYPDEGRLVDVENVDDYVNWLFEHYGY